MQTLHVSNMERIGVIASRLVAKLMAAREQNLIPAEKSDTGSTGTGRADDASAADGQTERFGEESASTFPVIRAGLAGDPPTTTEDGAVNERATKYTAAEVRASGGDERAVRKGAESVEGTNGLRCIAATAGWEGRFRGCETVVR